MQLNKLNYQFRYPTNNIKKLYYPSNYSRYCYYSAPFTPLNDARSTENALIFFQSKHNIEHEFNEILIEEALYVQKLT